MLESLANLSAFELVRLTELSPAQAEKVLTGIREIFFESSSRQTFKDSEEREAFFTRWTSDYFKRWSSWIYLALRDGEAAGYLMGCPDSERARADLSHSIPGYDVFADLFSEFPAHLHINVAAKFRGQKVGESLVERFARDLRGLSVRGVHIVTSPDARNRNFYERCGFSHTLIRPWRGQPLLFMGQTLSENGSNPA